jgi:hypothetical protein
MPWWMQRDRLSGPLHGVDGPSLSWGLCLTPASGGEALHLSHPQVIKTCGLNLASLAERPLRENGSPLPPMVGFPYLPGGALLPRVLWPICPSLYGWFCVFVHPRASGVLPGGCSPGYYSLPFTSRREVHASPHDGLKRSDVGGSFLANLYRILPAPNLFHGYCQVYHGL